jgi:hypothetical protein
MARITLAKNFFETKPDCSRNFKRAILKCLDDEDNDLREYKVKRLRQNHRKMRASVVKENKALDRVTKQVSK